LLVLAEIFFPSLSKAIESLEAFPDVELSDKEKSLLGVLLSNTAQTYLMDKDFPRAEQMLNKAVKLLPNDGKVLYRLGVCMLQRKNVQAAMEYALQAQRQANDVAVQKLIRDIQAIPTISNEVDSIRVSEQNDHFSPSFFFFFFFLVSSRLCG
jgi:tetratricopeptide (TPR) repeat protein